MDEVTRAALIAAAGALDRLHEIANGEHDGSESEIADTINAARRAITAALEAAK